MKINIKHLSVNRAWMWRRFKTKEYKNYEQELMWLLKPIELPMWKIKLVVTFWMSNKLSDIDNGLKPLIDILQKHYKFNDRDIYELHVKKEIVKKGEEFIDFDILPYAEIC